MLDCMLWCMETSGILELFSDDYYKSTACFVITCWIIIKVNQTFLNIGNITYTQTTSTKIQIGPSSRWVEIGFVGIHATHGSHTMPGKFSTGFQRDVLWNQRPKF